jgi:hypothetical protein
MDQHALLMHTLIRHTHFDTPESARRRGHLLWLEPETREARRRRRRQRIHRSWNALITSHRTVSDDSVRRMGAPDLQQELR